MAHQEGTPGPSCKAAAVAIRLAFIAAFLAAASADEPEPRPFQHSLDGQWTLSNKARGIQVAGSVPGGVYSDLRAAGQLPRDPFYRFNDEEYRWVGRENWTYERSFHVPPEAFDRNKQVLVLHGVDTVADVLLNGHLLGSTDNMFVRYRYSVKGLLKEDGSNLLEVRFTSPVQEAKRRAAEQAKQYVVPPECPDAAYHGECHANHLRKMQASFSWDWGPAFPSMGLWKSVQLEAYDEAVLRGVGFPAWPGEERLARGGPYWRASVRAHWESGTGTTTAPGGRGIIAFLHAAIADPDGEVVASAGGPVTLVADAEGCGHVDIGLRIPREKVKLWWPSGYGDQPLYKLTVTLSSPQDDQWDRITARTGLRTVRLVQEEVVEGDPSKGLTFYFRVNGVPVFAKGSNWIPAHVLPEKGAEPAVVRHLLHSAKEAHMNMLRVWGGGVYESDLFYQTCDELGIMVWQDLMFACAMYPVGDAFLRSVDREVRQQFRRLNHHPSIVLWAGNNENEAALRGNWYHTDGPLFDQYHRDYKRLYVDTVRAAIRDEGCKLPFAVSSPSNGAASEAEDYLARNPYSPLYGDDHHYDYVSDAWNPAVFHRTRFGSEYGFMSWPSRSTMLGATDAQHADEDLALGSALVAHRQHHPGGNAEIERQIKQHLPTPRDLNRSEHFEEFAYLSQIYQAMATKTETEYLRRARNLLTPNGEGRTMGALYWQLNDVWQAPSWAGIDFTGRWKMLHYYAVDFLAPLLVSPFVEAGTLNVDVVSDAEVQGNLLVHTDVMSWDSFLPRARRVNVVRLGGAGSTPRALATPLRPLLHEANCGNGRKAGTRWGCVLRFRLTSADNQTTPLASENYLFPLLPNDMAMPEARVEITTVHGPVPGTRHQPWDFILNVEATGRGPAAFVWLDAGPLRGRFSRNGFHLFQEGEVELRFHTEEQVSLDEFNRHVKVMALNTLAAHQPEVTPG